jgi:hypothetical protein
MRREKASTGTPERKQRAVLRNEREVLTPSWETLFSSEE